LGQTSPSTKVGPTDVRIGVLLSIIAVAVLSVWNAASLVEGNNFKYILYALPPLIWIVFAVVLRGKIVIERSAVYALMVYLFVAAISLFDIGEVDWYSARDLLIICSYIAVFALFFRSPRFVADALLGFCVIATVTVLLVRGVSSDMSITHPQGHQLLESVVSFPAGLLVLYYVSERQWGRGLITLVLFVLAFKRIAFVGVGAVLCLELCMYIFLRRPVGRLMTTAAVVAISIVALFSLQIFDFLTVLLNDSDASANSVSLGRAEMAAELWRQIDAADVSHVLTGFGPGAADRHLFVAGFDLNPHNDWLKILFDYGMVGFVGLHVVLRLLLPNTSLGNKFYLFTAILMTTGNPLIYTYYFVSLFLIVRIPPRLPAASPGFRDAAVVARIPNA